MAGTFGRSFENRSGISDPADSNLKRSIVGFEPHVLVPAREESSRGALSGSDLEQGSCLGGQESLDGIEAKPRME